MKGQFLILVLFLLYVKSDSYKILAIYGFASRSHLNVFTPVLNELAKRGHEVTIYQPYPDLKVHSAIKMLHSFDIGPMKEEGSKRLFIDNRTPPSIFEITRMFTNMADITARNCLSSPDLKSLLKAGKQFDIVLVSYILNEFAFALSPLLGNYTIYHAAGPIPNIFRGPAPVPLASVPNVYLRQAFPPVMTFWQRLTNTWLTTAYQLGYAYHVLPTIDKTVKEFVPQAPSLFYSKNKISLYLTNSDPVTGVAKPSVPNLVSVCCPHCRVAKPLPDDLEKFISTSGEDGFIMFGLGSHAQSKHIPKEMKDDFLNAFSKLKQKVIWKFEDDSIKPPANVFLMKWMPQQDILGHPKLRLFITHGGLLSLQEAIYHGVPLIGIPLFAEQYGNVAYIVEQGLGGRLNLNNITSKTVHEQISKILNDQGYKERMQTASSIIKDHTKGSVTQGANWIEYVARHNGAWHLRTIGEDMSLFQYFLIDVMLFLTVLSITGISLTVFLFRLAVKKLKKRKVKEF